MQWILQFIIGHRNGSSLILTVVLSLWMLSADETTQAGVSRALMLYVFYPVQYAVDISTRARNIFAENKRLRRELARMSTRAAALEEMARQNQRLRKLLGLNDRFSHELVPAHVVVREPSGHLRSVVIDVGRNNGLLPYMPVVGTDGVVGKLIQVLPHLSLVQLLKDPASRTSVIIRRNRTVGILETEDGENFFVKCRTHIEVAPGDTVITSGLGGVYPKGMRVGTIEKIGDDADPLFKRAFVEPFEDFSRIEEVFVLRLSPQWASFREALDSLEFEE